MAWNSHHSLPPALPESWFVRDFDRGFSTSDNFLLFSKRFEGKKNNYQKSVVTVNTVEPR